MAKTIQVRLSRDDHELVIASLDLPPPVRRHLVAGVLEGRLRRFDLATDEASALLEALTDAAAAATRRNQRRSLARLQTKLEDQIARAASARPPITESGYDPAPTAGFAPSRADSHPGAVSLRERIQELLERESFASLDEAEYAVQQLVRESNRLPLAELAGLSPVQAQSLLDNNWRPATPGLQVREDVDLERLAGSRFLHNARTFVRALGADGTPATKAGNLNRKFVTEMVNTLRWRSGYVDDLYRYNKVLNEGDVARLAELRVNLRLAGMIHKHRGRFLPTLGRLGLLDDDRAGELQSYLFQTWFRDFNLGYSDRLPELAEFQDYLAVSLWLLSQESAGWLDPRDVSPRVLMPTVVDSLPTYGTIDFGVILVELRMLMPLEEFGLVECEPDPDKPHLVFSCRRFRRTPLFSEFLRFEVPDRHG